MTGSVSELGKWKVLIVDDEREVHTITKLVMKRERILGREIEFLDAYNGSEAREILRANPDTALVLLDIIMIRKNEGLELARWIREELGNSMVRIVLRTGHPGDAPEMSVIAGYDINDYKEKSELTSKKLRSLFYTSLRNYRELSALNRYRGGLMRIIKSMALLYRHPSLEEFTAGVLEQIQSQLFVDGGAMYGISTGLGARKSLTDSSFQVIAAIGDFSETTGRRIADCLPNEIVALADRCMEDNSQLYQNGVFIQCMDILNEGRALLLLSEVNRLNEADLSLLKLFTENIALALSNLAERRSCLES